MNYQDIEAQHYWAQCESLEMINGIQYQRIKDAIGILVYRQLIVTYTLRLPILQQVHSAPTSRHFAVQKMVDHLVPTNQILNPTF